MDLSLAADIVGNSLSNLGQSGRAGGVKDLCGAASCVSSFLVCYMCSWL